MPVLSATGLPIVGSSLDLNVTQGLGGAKGWLLFGASQASIPALGGVILVQPPWYLRATTLSGTPGGAGEGQASVSFPIPDQPSLIGLIVDLQGLFADPGVPKNLSMTQGLEVRVGG